MSNAMTMFMSDVNKIVQTIKGKNVDGVLSVESRLGEEENTIVVRVIKFSAKHAKKMVVDYPMSPREVGIRDPDENAILILAHVYAAEEIGPNETDHGRFVRPGDTVH